MPSKGGSSSPSPPESQPAYLSAIARSPGSTGEDNRSSLGTGGDTAALGPDNPEASSSTTCALVPPKPKELTPARRVPLTVQGRVSVGMKKRVPRKSMWGLRDRKCTRGGRIPRSRDNTVLMIPAIPAAASR